MENATTSLAMMTALHGRLPRRRIYLMRHGDVSYFDASGTPRSSFDVPLNDEGRRQVAAAAEALASVQFDRAATSTLARSRQTAEIVLGSRGLSIEERAELCEIRPGSLTEVSPEQLEATVIDAFAAGLSRESRFLGGETFGELEDRVLPCLEELLADPRWRHLLLVAHGGVNRAILTHALASGLPGYERLEQDPGAINIIDVDATGRLLVRSINYTPYNPIKLGVELTTLEQLYEQFTGRRPR